MSTLELALTKNFLVKRSKLRPTVAVVLGSGFTALTEWVQPQTALDYASIPNFARGSVPGHSGQLIFGTTPAGRPLLVFAGRVHYYEGISMEQVAYPVHVAHALGAKMLIVTNAAGGLNPEYAPGELMLIRDHINLMGDNPLRGMQTAKGVRFPVMRDAYDLDLIARALDSARRHAVKLNLGVYAAMSGPAYETDAELRMLYGLGADAVGMSTVPEVMAARQLGMRVLGLSVIANDAFPHRRQAPRDVDHAEVLRVVEGAASSVAAIVKDVIEAD
jgi:purine-nucleoside phosphorylase